MSQIRSTDDRIKSLKNLIAASCAIIGLAMVILPSAAKASAILIDQGSTTYDKTSGLDWLDLTVTQGQSTDDAVSSAEAGGAGAGWRFATFAEVMALYVDAGVTVAPLLPNIYSVTLYGAGADSQIDRLISLLGVTQADDSFYQTTGWFLGSFPGSFGLATASVTFDGHGNVISGATILNNYAGPGSDANYGSFLVRDHVDVAVTPLPAALPMFGAATGLLSVMGWKRRRTQAG